MPPKRSSTLNVMKLGQPTNKPSGAMMMMKQTCGSVKLQVIDIHAAVSRLASLSHSQFQQETPRMFLLLACELWNGCMGTMRTKGEISVSNYQSNESNCEHAQVNCMHIPWTPGPLLIQSKFKGWVVGQWVRRPRGADCALAFPLHYSSDTATVRGFPSLKFDDSSGFCFMLHVLWQNINGKMCLSHCGKDVRMKKYLEFQP